MNNAVIKRQGVTHEFLEKVVIQEIETSFTWICP